MIGISRIKLAGIALAVSALGVGSTIQAQGTTCPPCGTSSCSANGCYSCNGTRQIGTYQQDGQTCTLLQSCSRDCPASGGACPSWGDPYAVPSSCTI